MSQQPVLKRFHVLLMTAASIEVEDFDETGAVQTAISGVKLKDPHEFKWVARAISDRPFDIADPGEEEIPPVTESKIITT